MQGPELARVLAKLTGEFEETYVNFLENPAALLKVNHRYRSAGWLVIESQAELFQALGHSEADFEKVTQGRSVFAGSIAPSVLGRIRASDPDHVELGHPRADSLRAGITQIPSFVDGYNEAEDAPLRPPLTIYTLRRGLTARKCADKQ